MKGIALTIISVIICLIIFFALRIILSLTLLKAPVFNDPSNIAYHIVYGVELIIVLFIQNYLRDKIKKLIDKKRK